jgi:molybdopterin-guanine dinucleotide biosynthesis protein A
MWCAGFVLAGGQSVRMGRDKALLPYGPATLVEATASLVESVSGHVAIVGDPLKYGQFGYPVYPDRLPGCGPMGGLQAALHLGLADWNLVVACDMPRLTAGVFSALLDRASSVAHPRLACLAPRGEQGEFEPLCAVYHSSCLPAVERALAENRFRMRLLLSQLNTVDIGKWPSAVFANVNTLEDWAGLRRDNRK